MYLHILLAADGSENAIRAAKEAMKLARIMKNSMIDLCM